MASDYQGETIQVFVFFRGKFLGYQCFGQDRLTVGGAPGMDLPLPDCPVEEGYWDVYVSRGALYAWFRSPAGGNGKVGHEDPRKVQPLDSFSLGEYRLQAKVLEGEGFLQPSTEAAEGLIEEEAALSPEEESARDEASIIEDGEEEQEASSFVDFDDEDGSEQEPAAETSDEVEGISLDYARSIWKGEAEDLPPDDEVQALAGEDQEGESEEEPSSEAREEAKAESPLGIDPHYAKSFWGLSEESDTVQEGDEGSESEVDEPDALDDEIPGMEEIDEWIGFGLEEEREDPVTLAAEEPPDLAVEMGSAADAEEDGESSAEEIVPVSGEASLSDSTCEPEGLQEMVPLETVTDEQAVRAIAFGSRFGRTRGRDESGGKNEILGRDGPGGIGEGERKRGGGIGRGPCRSIPFRGVPC